VLRSRCEGCLYCTGILLIVFFLNGVDDLDGWNEKKKTEMRRLVVLITIYQALASYH